MGCLSEAEETLGKVMVLQMKTEDVFERKTGVEFRLYEQALEAQD